jgi:hypothetical protein
MTSTIDEFTSLYYPDIVRVQFETRCAFFAGFTYSSTKIENRSNCVWTLIEEAVAQNARWPKHKQTHFFVFQVGPSGKLQCFRLHAVNKHKLKIQKTGFAPKRLVLAALDVASRHQFQALQTGEFLV